MRTLGEYLGAQRTLDGDLCIMFSIKESNDALEKLSQMQGKRVVLECKLQRPRRSLNANNMFYALCESIAECLGSTQDEIHDLMLYRYGQRGDLVFPEGMLQAMESNFDIVRVLNQEDGMIEARCWVGSRHYDTAEMSRLLQGTIDEAKALGCDAYDQEEIDAVIRNWEGG